MTIEALVSFCVEGKCGGVEKAVRRELRGCITVFGMREWDDKATSYLLATTVGVGGQAPTDAGTAGAVGSDVLRAVRSVDAEAAVDCTVWVAEGCPSLMLRADHGAATWSSAETYDPDRNEEQLACFLALVADRDDPAWEGSTLDRYLPIRALLDALAPLVDDELLTMAEQTACQRLGESEHARTIVRWFAGAMRRTREVGASPVSSDGTVEQ